MDNHLPSDLSNPNNSNPPPTPTIPIPPNIPENPDPPHNSTYSEVAQHKLRDSYGRFATDHINAETPQPDHPVTPSLWKRFIDYVIRYFKKLTLRKIITLSSTVYLITTNGPLQNGLDWLFPHSSPILHRQVAHQGILQTTGNGQYQLVLADKSVYTLFFKPSATLVNLKKINEAVVKGNLTWTPYVIENAEVYPLNITIPENTPLPIYNPPATTSGQPLP